MIQHFSGLEACGASPFVILGVPLTASVEEIDHCCDRILAIAAVEPVVSIVTRARHRLTVSPGAAAEAQNALRAVLTMVGVEAPHQAVWIELLRLHIQHMSVAERLRRSAQQRQLQQQQKTKAKDDDNSPKGKKEVFAVDDVEEEEGDGQDEEEEKEKEKECVGSLCPWTTVRQWLTSIGHHRRLPVYQHIGGGDNVAPVPAMGFKAVFGIPEFGKPVFPSSSRPSPFGFSTTSPPPPPIAGMKIEELLQRIPMTDPLAGLVRRVANVLQPM
jgi:hypothetical protein